MLRSNPPATKPSANRTTASRARWIFQPLRWLFSALVFLYRIRASPDAARRLLLVYLDRVNQLADRFEWYHLLSNNCTINIIRYANLAGRTGGFNFRHLLNGLIDRYLYAAGALDSTLLFDELRRRSHINEAIHAADGAPDFSQRIRAHLPPRASAP